MYSNKTVLIIADSWEYIKYYLKDKLNLKIVLFQSPSRKNRDKKELCEEIHYIDLTDKEYALKLAIRLNDKYDFKAVWSFTDEGVELAGYLGKALGLRYNPEEVSSVVNNKEKIRNLLLEANFSKEINYKLVSNKEELFDFGFKHGFPVIVKPNNGSGSVGVVQINNLLELEQYTNETNITSILIEEFVNGPEYSIETISFNGQHEVLQITEKLLFPETKVEMQHLMPANLSSIEKSLIELYIIRLLQIIGHRNGPCHIEIKLTPNGPVLIDAHTRPGGDFIVVLLSDIYGADVICETMNYLINGDIPIRSLKKEAYGLVRYFHQKPGKITNLNGLEKILKYPEVINYELNFNVGDVVPSLEHSFSRMGCIVLQSNSRSDITNLAEKIICELKFEFE